MEQQPPIRVLIVDDHMMVRKGLRVFLSVCPDIAVVGEAADGEEAFVRCREQAPDVILIDVVMPNGDGLTATARIRAAFPRVQVIALTSFVDESLVRRAMGAGAIGYLLKDLHDDQLATAIRDAHRGRATFAAAAAQALAHSVTEVPPALTKREGEVLRLLVQGKTNSEIATVLGISRGTANLHVSNILSKLGVDNRTEAAMIAVQHKLLP